MLLFVERIEVIDWKEAVTEQKKRGPEGPQMRGNAEM
jgi:hypothetical protein